MNRIYWSYFRNLSLLYFVFFYLLPSFYLFHVDGVFSYAGEYFWLNTWDVLVIIFYGSLFIFSFLFSIKLFSRKDDYRLRKKSLKLNRVAVKIAGYIFLLLYILFFFYFNDVDEFYAARQGLEQGDRLKFFLSIIIGVLGAYFILLWDELGYKRGAFIIALVFLLANIFSGAGRWIVLFYVLLIFFILYKGDLNKKLLLIGGVVLIFLLPFIINMKSVLYGLAVDGSLNIDLIVNAYNWDGVIDGYFANFGHPVVAMLVAEDLIEKIGYRFFYDYLQGFLFFARLVGLDFGDSLTYYITEEITGIRGSVVPPGYVAFGFIQMNFFGVVVSGVLYSFVGFFSNFVRTRLFPNSKVACFYFSFVAANSFYHGEVRLIVMTVFLGLGLMLFYDKLFALFSMDSVRGRQIQG